MDFLQTPKHRFDDLADYPFAPNYQTVGDGLVMHYVDENRVQKDEVVLMLHGEPSWSYLYRWMIPIFKDAGFRAIAPDLIGFGKSDKPTSMDDYSYQKYVDWMWDFIVKLDLNNITLFCQDWGGLIGLRVAAEHPERFKRIVASNTFLPTGATPMPKAFFQWQKFVKESPEFHIGRAVKNGCYGKLTEAVIAAYDAPFPDDSYKAGARIFPSLVPTSTEDPAFAPNTKAWDVLHQWKKPFLTLFSDQDPITKGADRLFHAMVPGCKDMPHDTIKDAGHFLQEEKGEEIAHKVVDFIKNH